jgi:hypothetical protein
VLLWMLAWKWIRCEDIEAASVKILGTVLLFSSVSAALSIGPAWRPWSGTFSAGGMLGLLLADALRASLNRTGAVLLTSVSLIVSLYLISTFSMSTAARWLAVPMNYLVILRARWDEWRERRRELALERARQRAEQKAAREQESLRALEHAVADRAEPQIPIVEPLEPQLQAVAESVPAALEEIPIHALEYEPAPQSPAPVPVAVAAESAAVAAVIFSERGVAEKAEV